MRNRPVTAEAGQGRSEAGGLLPIIHQILLDDLKAPKKQRHTARRIFQRLRDEHDSRAARQSSRTPCGLKAVAQGGFPADVSSTGRSPGGFGEATVRLAGQETKVALFVMTLPYSGAIYFRRFRGNARRRFWRDIAGLSSFGGVPRRVSYDNSAIAVIEVLTGRERKLTKEFLRLQSHYLFQEHFCLVRRPNREGTRRATLGLRSAELSRACASGRFARNAQQAALRGLPVDLRQRRAASRPPRANCSWKTRPSGCRCPSSPSRRGLLTTERPTRSRWFGSIPTITRFP